MFEVGKYVIKPCLDELPSEPLWMLFRVDNNELSVANLHIFLLLPFPQFLTRASPFQPFSNLGDPIADLAMVLVVPEGNLADYLKGVVGGTTNFAGKVALEALNTSAKITRFAVSQLNSKALPSAGIKSSGREGYRGMLAMQVIKHMQVYLGT